MPNTAIPLLNDLNSERWHEIARAGDKPDVAGMAHYSDGSVRSCMRCCILSGATLAL